MTLERAIRIAWTVVRTAILTVLSCLFLGGFSIANAASVNDRDDIAAFADRFFSEQMAKHHIPGAVFVLVKDGEIVVSKGYGYADLERKIPVNPETTGFRVGSVSKLVTATAVMQLVERGKVELDAPVNRYLQRLKIDNPYAKPVTLSHLLTHTSGMDESFIGIAAKGRSQRSSLEAYLRHHLPPIAFEPGTILRYSNHGFALAGYTVESASKMSFSEYADRHIFAPLQMHHSSFQVSPQIAKHLATGYRYRDGNYRPVPPIYTNDVPSGALSTTATDMAHFAIAHLQQGRYGNAQILQPDTARQMHRQQFTHHPRLPGQAYGFYERFENGLRAIEHDGHLTGFRSRLFLLPEQNLGFFLSYNKDDSRIHDRFIREFLDRYYPAPAGDRVSELPNLENSDKVADRNFTGVYRSVRYPHAGVDKLAAVLPGSPLFAPEIRVNKNRDGTLALKTNRWIEVKPMLFQSTSGSPAIFKGVKFDRIAFGENTDGRVRYLFIGKHAFQQLAWFDRPRFHIAVFAICICGFIANLVYQFNVRRRGELFKLKPLDKLDRNFAGTICCLDLGFTIAFSTQIALADLSQFAYGLPPLTVALLVLPLVATALTFGWFVLLIIRGITNARNWSCLHLKQSLFYLANSLVFIGFLWLLDYWNLLGLPG